jgi:hypothetical protein
MKTVETEIKYAGYLEQQKKSMARLKRDEQRVIPAEFDYAACSGLSREMVEKLGKVRPRTLGQASRIAGVTPAAVALVNCFIEIQARTSQFPDGVKAVVSCQLSVTARGARGGWSTRRVARYSCGRGGAMRVTTAVAVGVMCGLVGMAAGVAQQAAGRLRRRRW